MSERAPALARDCSDAVRFISSGWSRESRADAIARHLWPSQGLELIGFELKVSRSDWLREIKDPYKCESKKAFAIVGISSSPI
jgi:hypothetical protein